jgi:Ca2+ transporting ATPase
MFTAFVGSVVLKESPLQPIQLLWVNLIMDSFASLALATEPPSIKLLDKEPYKRDEYIVSRKMMKNMLAMAAYMIIIIYAIVFAGETFYPEPDIYWRISRPDVPYLFPGRVTDWDGTPLYSVFESRYGSSRHMTNVFNVFVILQIFNLINARRIDDDPNVFAGLFKNWMFVGVWIGIAIAQVIIVEFTSVAFKVSPGGLHWSHWVIAVGLGFTTWIAAFFFKFIPDAWCPQFGSKQKNPLEDESSNVLALRRKRTQSFSLRQPGGINKEGSDSGRQGSFKGSHH